MDDHAGRRVLRALASVARRMLDPVHYREDEVARRAFLDVGFAALCRHRHPVQRTAEDHLALFQMLDWPRASGVSVAEEVADALGDTNPGAAAAVRAVARANLALLRITARAGRRLYFEELWTGRTLHGLVPEAPGACPGETVIARLVEAAPVRLVPLADLLIVPHAAVADLEHSLAEPEAPTAPSPRAKDAARLFRAWTRMAFADERGVIEPRDHAGEFLRHA